MSVALVQVTVEIGHQACYRKKATTFKTHDWVLFVRGVDGKDISHFVEKIVYNLHESFVPSRRVKDKPPYELHESGYGEFYPMVDIYFKNKGEKAPRKVSIQYFLNLNREDAPPIKTSRHEKITFHHPSEEFLEKVLKAGGKMFGEDGQPMNSRPRISSSDSHAFDSRKIHGTDSDAKSSSHKGNKLHEPAMTPMSNLSVSSSDSFVSRHSSKSDSSGKESSTVAAKRKHETFPFDLSDDDVQKKKKKLSSEKPDHGKPKSSESAFSTESKPVKREQDVDKRHRSSKEDSHKHSSKSHNQERTQEHHEKSSHSSGSSSGKQKSGGSSSRSSSQTTQSTAGKNPEKLKSSESSGSRVHSSSSHSKGSDFQRGLSSSGSHTHSSSKNSRSKSSSSHRNGRSHKSDQAHHSSKHHGTEGSSDTLTMKQTVQVCLSPVDGRYSSSEMNSKGSAKSAERQSTFGDVLGRSPEDLANRKSSPMKYRSKTNPIPSPISHLSGDCVGKPSEGTQSALTPENQRIRPKYDKLLDDMKSDDEEEDGEIRSPLATEPSDLGLWKNEVGGGDRREERSKDVTGSDRKKSSKSSSSSAAYHSDKVSSSSEKTSPSKQRSDQSSLSSSEKKSPEFNLEKNESSYAGSHGKTAKKTPAKENVVVDSKSTPKKSADSKSAEPKHISFRKIVETVTQKDILANDISSSLAEENGNSFEVDVLSDASDDRKADDSIKENQALNMINSARAPNGELLETLVDIQRKLNDSTNCQLLNQIVDVIEACGKFQLDEESFMFDLCDLDANTVRRVRELMDGE